MNMHSWRFTTHQSVHGFTLVELMVVVTILGILTAIAFSTFSTIQQSARDAQRQADLKVIQSALEQYHADQGFYPDTLIVGESLVSVNGSKNYLRVIPHDPANSSSTYSSQYRYLALPNAPNVCDNTPNKYCTKYCLYAKLERASDQNSSCSDDPDRTYEITSP